MLQGPFPGPVSPRANSSRPRFFLGENLYAYCYRIRRNIFSPRGRSRGKIDIFLTAPGCGAVLSRLANLEVVPCVFTTFIVTFPGQSDARKPATTRSPDRRCAMSSTLTIKTTDNPTQIANMANSDVPAPRHSSRNVNSAYASNNMKNHKGAAASCLESVR